MAPIQVRLRKAIGLLKDQTSISIAKVASAGTPDLEVAIVKATSHDEAPAEERYVQAVLHLTSFSRAHVKACVCNIARRLNKTSNWVVAIKALILAHRLLRDGDAAFEKELMLSRRQGMCVLNVSDFRDESHSNGWDFSGFIHAYGLYLDERLDCCSLGSFGAAPRPERRHSYKDSGYEYSDSVHHRDSVHPHDSYGSPYHDAEKKQPEKETSKSMKNMKPDELIENLPAFQRLLERVLACRPTGPAKVNRLVNVALYAVIRESFVLYADLQDGLAILRDVFFDMDSQDCGRVLDIYSLAAKQMEELIPFYSFCKALGVCRTAEYPSVEVISKDLLLTMEDFVRDGSRRRSPEPGPPSPQNEIEEATVNDMKVLPAPPPPAEEFLASAPVGNVANMSTAPINSTDADLLDIRERTISAEEHGDKLALALFSGTRTKAEAKWEAFPEQGTLCSPRTSASNGASGWELALIESESELSKPNDNTLAGGFDHLLLESLYEQGVDRQRMLSTTAPTGSASSIALAGRPQSNFLALPAPSVAATAWSSDPFAASESVPCPAYVQMSEMQQKQQLLVQEQQQWLQY
eukprot:c13424_g2_i1 orf=1-1737(-)